MCVVLEPPDTHALSLLQRMAIAETNAETATRRAKDAEERADAAAIAAYTANSRHRRLTLYVVILAIVMLAGTFVLYTQVIYREARTPYVDSKFQQLHDELTALVCTLPPVNELTVRLRAIAACPPYRAPHRHHHARH